MKTNFFHSTVLCFALMGSLTGFSMQGQKGGAEEDNGDGPGVAAAAVGAYGEDSRRECREDSSTRPCMYALGGVALVSLLANLGLVGGWVGDHFGNSDCDDRDDRGDNHSRFNVTADNINMWLEYCRLLLEANMTAQ